MITKEQAQVGAKVKVPTRKTTGQSFFQYQDELRRQNVQPYGTIAREINDLHEIRVEIGDDWWYFTAADLDLYEDAETQNPTSYPLPGPNEGLYARRNEGNAEQVAHLHGQGEKTVLHEWAGIKIVAAAEYPAFSDPINPDHYNADTITAFDVVKAWNLDFFLGNVAKYIQRRGRKGSELEDLKKAAAYLAEKIKQVEAEE